MLRFSLKVLPEVMTLDVHGFRAEGMEASDAARRSRRCCSRESRSPSTQMRPHQRASRQATSAAAPARHNTAGHGLLAARPKPAPMRKPTMAPRTINAFIRCPPDVQQNVCQPPKRRLAKGKNWEMQNFPLAIAASTAPAGNFLPAW